MESDDGGDLHSEWARAETEAETKWQENAELVRDISNHRALLGESSVIVKYVSTTTILCA
jgi:hypothetical protein